MLARSPFAGVAWTDLQYVEGFRRLGHDVYYIEDTGGWSYDPEQDCMTDDGRYAARYLAGLMEWCGMPDRWAYRGAQGGSVTLGLSESQVNRVLEEADALINLHGSTTLREEHLSIPIRAYVETDPVRTQIELAKGMQATIDWVGAHTHHFTYAENLGAADCTIPACGVHYRPTRYPIILDWWTPESLSRTRGRKRSSPLRFTTVTSWDQSGDDIKWNGETYLWSKHLQFLKFIDVPRRSGRVLEMALASKDPKTVGLLTSNGWRVVDAMSRSSDILPYREYIFGSDGEFTVAKDQYIRPRSGWFSDRSACYLAAGCPVITQESGFSNIFPTGEGLFGFQTMEGILEAFDVIHSDYERHSRAARAIAEEYFDAEAVLGRLTQDLVLRAQGPPV